MDAIPGVVVISSGVSATAERRQSPVRGSRNKRRTRTNLRSRLSSFLRFRRVYSPGFLLSIKRAARVLPTSPLW